MLRRQLHDSWTVRLAGHETEAPEAIRDLTIPATVPGCVHTDLLAAGHIPDPYIDRNESDVQWIGLCDWQYEATFDVSAEVLAHERVDLVCDGLDTVAKIAVNGTVIGQSESMHSAHRFPMKSALKHGENRLTVTFASAVRYAREQRDRLGSRPHVEISEPYNFVRKMACNFGWDWGPILVTCGVWQPIRLEGWSGVRIDSVRPLVTSAARERAVVDVNTSLTFAEDSVPIDVRVVVNIVAPDGKKHEQVSDVRGEMELGQQTTTLEIPEPQLWWPHTHGDQPLYDVTVTLRTADGDELDAWSSRIGMRTVRLNTDADEIGSAFQFEINGEPVYCRGANWIPDDCFPTRITEERYRQRLEQAVDMNMNMLRVWGGGIYELESFYRLCDELGIMVWQDFLFACAAYPEEEPFTSLVREEARHQIIRLSPHPSLVLWNGNNENIWGYFDWQWKDVLGDKTWGAGWYLDLLPSLVAEYDPTRPYWPGSPYSGSMDLHPNDVRHGNNHVWDAWNQKDYAVYRDYPSRFVSEFGWQAPPTWPTLVESIPEDQRFPDSPAMLHHQKADDGQKKLTERCAEHFVVPEDMNDWHYVMQLNQARAITTGVEYWRSQQPRNMGTLYWQINDCWPVSSWSAVDGYGRPKLLWHATKRFFADRLLTIQPDDGGLTLYAVNDSKEAWTGAVEVARMSFDGTEHAVHTYELDIAPRMCEKIVVLPDDITKAEDGTSEFVVAQSTDTQTFWYFASDKDLQYPTPEYETELTPSPNGVKLVITAVSFLRDLCVFADRLDLEAAVDTQLITLLPGESHEFEIATTKQIRADAFSGPPIVQCANRFGAE